MAYTPPTPGMPTIQDTYGLPNIGVKVLVYGKAGIGKTRLCATAPAPIILSAERGLLSLRNYHIPFIEIKSLADLKGARQYLEGNGGAQFQTICLDSVSELADVVLTHEIKNNSNIQRAYGQMADAIIEEFRLFRNLPKHVVFTAQMGSKRDEGRLVWGPALPGQVLDQRVPYLFDETFQVLKGTDPQTGAEFVVLRTQPDNQFEAKDRSGSLAPWEYPDLNYVFNKIMGVA